MVAFVKPLNIPRLILIMGGGRGYCQGGAEYANLTNKNHFKNLYSEINGLVTI